MKASAPYHPRFIEEFFRRAALLFCVALRSGVPLRGAVTFGQGAFHAKTSVFVRAPLVEASGLEQGLSRFPFGGQRMLAVIPSSN
jgi:hypothetical protein